jgi:formyl-CoA transferase
MKSEQTKLTALNGMRVLDLTQVMSGPFATMQLADLGADVIKIENPIEGDQTRRSWGNVEDTGDSLAFISLNRNKRSVSLDLKDPIDLQKFYSLVPSADVVIENWRPGVASRLKVDWEVLKKINPRLVYASISGFGQTGPYANRPGYDLIAQAMGGAMSITGEVGGNPVKCGIPIGDLGAGLFATIGVLAAYISAKETGIGQYVETSLFESVVSLAVWESTEYWRTGETPQALGSANRMSAPYQAVQSSDGYFVVGANNQGLWKKFCEILEVSGLENDARFITNNDRMANTKELITEIEKRTIKDTSDNWVEKFLSNGVPAGPIVDYRYVFDSDPQVKSREMIVEVEHPVLGKVKVLNSPIKMGKTPVSIRRAPPILGQHNREIFAEDTRMKPLE